MFNGQPVPGMSGPDVDTQTSVPAEGEDRVRVTLFGGDNACAMLRAHGALRDCRNLSHWRAGGRPVRPLPGSDPEPASNDGELTMTVP
ncbi:MAG: hypothetical protein C0524_09045 [Rhodobacter sp.]|nr:hypothetical protein [Rhodobacter sp.]